MKVFNFLIICFLFLLFLSCGKKEEEIQEQKPTSQQTTKEEKKDTTKNNKTEEKSENKKSEDSKYKHELIPEKTVSPLEAGDYVGKIVTVKGFIADVHKSENVEYLNFIEKYPNNPFTGVIFKSKFDELGDVSIYENKNVELTGLITQFRGKPQIILDSKSQIKITK